ncbi:tail protein [Caudoviricetes sp.]|nr:tail protein [Caudoviricetes sp.]
MRFSKSKQTFYPEDIQYDLLPNDLVNCTIEEFELGINRPTGATLDIKDGKVFIVPPPPLDLSFVKATRWNAIKAERDRRIQNGGYKVGAKWFHSDTFSRTQQVGLVMMGANIPAGTPWKTMDGSTVTVTQTLAGQIFGTAAASDIAIFAAAETHRVAMEASADPATYDFSTGWPKAFGE